MEIINPANSEVITSVDTETEQSVTDKFNRAKAAQIAWAELTFSERADKIKKFDELMQERKQELAETQTEETGKPISQSLGEVGATSSRIKFFLEETEKYLEDEVVRKNETNEERIGWEPLGVIANISAWNYPWFVGANVFIPALLTGNAVLYKPSEFSTLTGNNIAKIMSDAGVPEDIFIPVIGGGDVGAHLLNQNINGVFFTGSAPTGKKIASAVADKLIKIQLELGGKDPMYVREDVDIDEAVESLISGAFYNTGQSCCAVERIYVHDSIADEFIKKFVEGVKNLIVGDPKDENTFIGPLTRADQLNVLKKQVDDAVEKGAKLLVGGKNLDIDQGNFFDPTVLVDVTNEMIVMKEESFGPIIGIQKVNSDEEAILLMNDIEYGLTAGIYTKDKEMAENLLKKLNAGSVYWNCCDRVSPYLPWTGRRNSGIGSTLSYLGIKAFLQPKAWHL